MLNVVYLVLIMSGSTAALSIPQANMKQCEANASHQMKSNTVYSAKCIAGVMPK